MNKVTPECQYKNLTPHNPGVICAAYRTLVKASRNRAQNMLFKQRTYQPYEWRTGNNMIDQTVETRFWNSDPVCECKCYSYIVKR
jgi:hypothetical protein